MLWPTHNRDYNYDDDDDYDVMEVVGMCIRKYFVYGSKTYSTLSTASAALTYVMEIK